MDECEFSLEKLSCFFLAPSRVEMGFNSPFPDVGDSFQAHCRVPAPPPTRVSVTSEIGRVLFAALRPLALNSNPDLKSRRLRLPYSLFLSPYSSLLRVPRPFVTGNVTGQNSKIPNFYKACYAVTGPDPWKAATPPSTRCRQNRRRGCRIGVRRARRARPTGRVCLGLLSKLQFSNPLFILFILSKTPFCPRNSLHPRHFRQKIQSTDSSHRGKALFEICDLMKPKT